MKDHSRPDKFRSSPILKRKSFGDEQLGDFGHFFSSLYVRGPRRRLPFPIIIWGLEALRCRPHADRAAAFFLLRALFGEPPASSHCPS